MTTKAELAQENTDLKIEIHKAHQALTELRAYLLSPKFHRDTTVQTADVLRRLDEVKLPYDEQVARWVGLTTKPLIVMPTMFKYYEVIATIDGEDEVLFGSYDRSDCLYEKEAESFWWKDQGYRQIRISHRLVSEAPDPEVYSDL